MILHCGGPAEECTCDCHRDSNVRHFMACCEQCPHCLRNIAYGYETHVKHCAEEHRKILARVQPPFDGNS